MAPIQRGLLLVAVGARGVGFTVTEVVPAALPQPVLVTLNEYVPEPEVVTAAIVGFCEVEVKLLGPVHE